MKRWIVLLSLMLAVLAQAELVHVYQEALAGGTRSQLSDETKETGSTYTTQVAPTLNGYIFTHWSIATTQSFTNRDRLGRAKDAASYTLYEETTLTANYLLQNEDADADGVADGWELYWYGDLSKNGASDTDGDGYTFAEELSAGTNPLMVNESIAGGIVWADGELLQYNPDNLQPYTIRSEPEGSLFATVSDYLPVGSAIPIPSVGASFAYWMVDGVRQADRHGRAKDTLSIAMPSTAIEIVAVSESDEARRNALYWYGDASVSMESDTDGDGYTFAEELSAGTNPLMADISIAGGVVWVDGELLQYNPYNLQAYTIRSEPEGTLFATVSDYLTVGTTIPMPSAGSTLAYWTVDGVRQADRHGRAKDTISMAMPSSAIEIVAVSENDESRRNALYWYGDASVSMESDTDGDGYTFAEELSAGTNPLMADESIAGGIAWADGALHEINLQPYEQGRGAIVDGGYLELFTSPVAGNGGVSRTFDGAATPTVADLNGDGLFDLVVETPNAARTVYLNVGVKGAPAFKAVEWNADWLAKFEDAKPRSLDGLVFDVQPVNVVSWVFVDVDADGAEDLLVADKDGRIWYYRGSSFAEATEDKRYVLQHKVWGGSYAGFAKGPMISVVDWDNDGDIDLVCGTADGKLMLLSDPELGRPQNLQANAGVTDVVLSWNPSTSPRTRGYGVYRSNDEVSFAEIAESRLPQYRDSPENMQDSWYRVTGKSRRYVAGSSTPVVQESKPSDAVRVEFGKVSVWLTDTSAFTCSNATVIVSMNNTMGLSSNGMSFQFTYDDTILDPVKIVKRGLTQGLTLVDSASGGVWNVSATDGNVEAGSGRFIELVFRVKDVHDVTSTIVSLVSATLKTSENQAVNITLPQSATIEISDSNPIVPAIVSAQIANAAVDTGIDFEMPVTITTSEVLTNFTADVLHDETMLRFDGWVGNIQESNLALRFHSLDQHSVVTNFSTVVALTNVVGVDIHDFVVEAPACSGTVLIKNANPILPAVVTISTEDKRVDTLEYVTIPFKISSSHSLASGVFNFEYDTNALEYAGAEGSITINATGDFELTFLAKDQHDITQTEVCLVEAHVEDVYGFTVYPAVPLIASVIIHDAHPLIPAVVAMTLSDVAASTENEFEMVLSITSTEQLTSLAMNIDYDATLLELRSGTLDYEGSVPGSVTLRFYAKENHTVNSTTVTITPVGATDHNGFSTEIILPEFVTGNVILADSNPWQPATVSANVSGVKVDTLTEFNVPVTITSNETLTNFVATVVSLSDAIEYRGANPVVFNGEVPSSFNLPFYAKDQHDITSAEVKLTNVAAIDNHGLVANPISDATGTVLIHDANPPVPADVALRVGSANVKTLNMFELPVAITSSKVLTSVAFDIDWNQDLLEYRGITGANFDSGSISVSNNIPSVITLIFYAKDQHTATSATVSLSNASAKCTDNLDANITLFDGSIAIVDSNPPVPPQVALALSDTNGKSGGSVTVPLTVTSVGELATLNATVAWDAERLAMTSPIESDSGSAEIASDGSIDLVFNVKPIINLSTNTTIQLVSTSGSGANGLPAQIVTELPVFADVIITRDIAKFDPGDVDGDGVYTEKDVQLVASYIRYLFNPRLGSKLSGNAKKAADVNGDGKVDGYDLALIQSLIAESQNGGAQ